MTSPECLSVGKCVHPELCACVGGQYAVLGRYCAAILDGSSNSALIWRSCCLVLLYRAASRERDAGGGRGGSMKLVSLVLAASIVTNCFVPKQQKTEK